MISILDEAQLKEKLRNRGRDLVVERHPNIDKIIMDVRKNKDSALFKYTKKYDNVEISEIRVSNKELDEQSKKVSKEFLKAIDVAKKNIEKFHKACMPKEIQSESNQGIKLGQIIRPYSRIGCYIPAGKNVYPSSVLMNVIPAKVAGVGEIFLATPPQIDGKIDPHIAACAKQLEIDGIFKVGGAQAIAAFAFGTESVSQVEKIVGPGNKYVAYAKKYVSESIDTPVVIDFFAGPSDVLILADDTANPKFVAYDLLSQAEHDVNSSAILITTSKSLAQDAKKKVDEIYESSENKDILKYSLKDNSAIIIKEEIDDCINLANYIAPEHLQIISKDEKSILSKITNAGSIFLGQFTPVTLGDYISGTNHVLPTGGISQLFSGLNVDSFLKKPTWQRASKESLKRIKKYIETLCDVEKFVNHKNAVLVRLDEIK